jgi:dipeptidyl aminopeptidase/acylaminoacyl peptidase
MKYRIGLFCLLVTIDGTAGLAPEDYYRIETPADPRISPDGKLVAYTVTSFDRKLNRRYSAIWLAPLDGRPPVQLTRGESANAPRWSPDGRTLAFLSARRDANAAAPAKAQVYALAMSGGEGRALTSLRNGVTAFQWSPDGSRLACVSRIGTSDSFPSGKERSDVRHYVNPGYKIDGSGFFDDRRAHIWIVDVQKGSAKQITFGDERNDGDPRWSPDGASIAFVSQRTGGNIGRGSDLFVVPAGGGAPLKVSDLDVGIAAPRWSPDGKRLAYIASENEIAIPKMFISPAAGGKSKPVNGNVTFATELEWTGNGAGLYYVAAFRGEHAIFRMDLSTREYTRLTSRSTVRQMDVDHAAGTLVFTSADETHPGDVFATLAGGGGRRQLTHLNTDLLAGGNLQPFEDIHYKGPDGWDVEGFFAKPAGWRPGKTYPMILMIHGGPNGMWGYQWTFDAQVFAAHGWAVLFTNPRGSSGYGEAFQRGVDREWGGKAYEDVMAGVDAALGKYPWIDRSRLGVSGHSFGGFMTDWIVGHTNRFKAAATLAGISDFISVEGTRDGFYGHSRDFGGDVFENFDLYWKYSPVRYAGNVKTPTLVLHGESDQRVPLEQGEQFFRALRRFGVPSELVIFPREGHGLRAEPKHAVELAKWQVYWFERFVEGKVGAVPPDAP